MRSHYSFEDHFCLDDIVVATCDRPEDAMVHMGECGRVAEVLRSCVLIDWFVEPREPGLHRGGGSNTLPEPTGWYIHEGFQDTIRVVDQGEEFDPGDIEELF